MISLYFNQNITSWSLVNTFLKNFSVFKKGEVNHFYELHIKIIKHYKCKKNAYMWMYRNMNYWTCPDRKSSPFRHGKFKTIVVETSFCCKLFQRKDKSGEKAKSHEFVMLVLPTVVECLLCANLGNCSAMGAAPTLLLPLLRPPV